MKRRGFLSGMGGLGLTPAAMQAGVFISPIWVLDESPAMGACDGKNRIYTLSRTPASMAQLALFYNGIKLMQESFAMIDARRLLLVTTPAKGDSVAAWYQGIAS